MSLTHRIRQQAGSYKSMCAAKSAKRRITL
jgi:hypothetical protein